MGPVLGVLDDRYARRATSPRPQLVRTPHFAPDGPQRPAQTPLGKAGGCHSLARGSQASNPLTSPPARRSTHPGAWLLVLPHHGRERSTAGLNAQIHCSPQTISGRAQSKRRRSIRNGMRACQRRLRWRPAFALRMSGGLAWVVKHLQGEGRLEAPLTAHGVVYGVGSE
jgi:hypothetical protein